jgi:hypothetical protein
VPKRSIELRILAVASTFFVRDWISSRSEGSEITVQRDRASENGSDM